MQETNLGIIGQGFVGSAVKEGMQNYFKVFAFDKDPNKFSSATSIFNVVENTELTFLCVPTPMKKSGACDLSILNAALDEISKSATLLNKKNYIVVIKSTIPPGTLDHLSSIYTNLELVFNPEFLTEANAIDDYKNQNRIVIGGDRPGTTKVKQVFSKAFPQVPIIKTSATIAEMIKYVTNTFLALKVSYANEMYQICQGLGIDYDKVIEYARYDERLGNSHWTVPGPDGDFGHGGHCLIKDTAALTHLANQLGVTTTMLEATTIKNNEVRTLKDWEGQIGRAVSEDYNT